MRSKGDRPPGVWTALYRRCGSRWRSGGPRAQGSLFSPQYVLAVGSSVFYAMFYGDLAEVKSEIHIPDVEPAAFLILLK